MKKTKYYFLLPANFFVFIHRSEKIKIQWVLMKANMNEIKI